MKRYFLANDAALALLGKAMSQWHAKLFEEEVKVALVMVDLPRDDQGIPTGPALSRNGLAITAQSRLLNERDRLVSGRDLIIEVDALHWGDIDDPQRLAILDHELTHVQIRKKKEAFVRRADGSVRLGLIPDDYAMTGFVICAKRHGRNSAEVRGLAALRAGAQLLFDFAMEMGEQVGSAAQEIIDALPDEVDLTTAEERAAGITATLTKGKAKPRTGKKRKTA
jgi:hypothetical protein